MNRTPIDVRERDVSRNRNLLVKIPPKKRTKDASD